MSNARILPPWPAAPGNNATIILINTAQRAAGGAGQAVPPPFSGAERNRWAACTVTWHKNDQASAANGVRVYASDDGGVNWYETDLKDDNNVPSVGAAAPIQVPILAAGQEWRDTFIVAHLKDFAIEYTAGATGPTNWKGTIAVELDDVAVMR